MGRLKHDVGWAPAEPTEARRPLEPAKAWKPDKLAEAPPVPPAIAPGLDVTNQNSLIILLVVSAFCINAGDEKQEQGVNI